MVSSAGTEANSPRPIEQVAADLGLLPEEIERYGRFAAKVSAAALARLSPRPPGRLVLVTSVTPTPAGEGKTTLALGLLDALRRLDVRAALTLRQPSLGPVFGLKGGGGGGGRARVVPLETLNLHLTGDLHAVAAAHNLAAAVLDNHLHRGNALEVVPESIRWPRAVDADDRALRRVRLGLGGPANGPERDGEWIVTAASEVMAALALADDVADLRRRLGRMVVAHRRGGGLATLEDLRVAGAMAVLLVEAMKPNLMQTMEGSPVLVHAGPFGNVAHGCSSVVADRLALRLADLVITEAGFGADLGAEKFVDIKCRASGLRPSAAVLVATVRALRAHGNGPGPEAFRRGAENLARCAGILRGFGIPVVVALNAFPSDDPADRDALCRAGLEAGARAAVVASPWADGGAGALELAAAVREAAAEGAPAFRPLYPDELPLADKVVAVATRVYGADGVDWLRGSAAEIQELGRRGFGSLPVCMAKTHLSLSHDASLGASPRGFRVPVREVRLAAGAGFATVLCGEVRLMPGLPAHPAAEEMDVDSAGRITGLR